MNRRRFLMSVSGAFAIGRKTERQLPSPKDFVLSDLDGRPFKLSSWKGKVLLLDFWATWCEPCIADVPAFNKLHEKYGGLGLSIVGVAIQSGWAKDIRPHVIKHKISYTVLVGNDKVVEDYNVIGFPTNYLISPDWRIHKKYLGTLPDKEADKAADIEREIRKLLAFPSLP